MDLSKYGISKDNKDLQVALTHTSYANEHNIESYERLEYLGDAVLELVISDYFYKNTKLAEGQMSKKRSMYVCEEALDAYAKEITDYLAENNIRVELDDRNEKLGYRVREAQTEKVPYTLILGDNEKENEEISYRLYSSKDTTTLKKADFLKLIQEEIRTKALRK